MKNLLSMLVIAGAMFASIGCDDAKKTDSKASTPKADAAKKDEAKKDEVKK